MNALIVTFFFISVQSIIILPKVRKECVKQTNLTVEKVIEALGNEQMKNQLDFKKYLKCVYQRTNLMLENGNVNLLPLIEPHRKLVETYEKCQKLSAPDSCDRASELHDCLKDVDMKKYVIPDFY